MWISTQARKRGYFEFYFYYKFVVCRKRINLHNIGERKRGLMTHIFFYPPPPFITFVSLFWAPIERIIFVERKKLKLFKLFCHRYNWDEKGSSFQLPKIKIHFPAPITSLQQLNEVLLQNKSIYWQLRFNIFFCIMIIVQKNEIV